MGLILLPLMHPELALGVLFWGQLWEKSGGLLVIAGEDVHSSGCTHSQPPGMSSEPFCVPEEAHGVIRPFFA